MTDSCSRTQAITTNSLSYPFTRSDNMIGPTNSFHTLSISFERPIRPFIFQPIRPMVRYYKWNIWVAANKSFGTREGHNVRMNNVRLFRKKNNLYLLRWKMLSQRLYNTAYTTITRVRD